MREYGLLIERRNDHGTSQVWATVCAREDGKDYPLGCSGDGENEFDKDVPKHMHGLLVDGLGLYGFLSEHGGHFYGADLEYRNVFSVNLPKTERMTRTLKRVWARFNKDQAREPGDRFAALASALKLTFTCERLQPEVTARTGEKFRFMPLAEGRNRYRVLIEEAEKAMQDKLGLTKGVA
jgi:hypothetical protein